jgi:hypothetical protein
MCGLSDRELDAIDAIVRGKSMVWPWKRAQRQDRGGLIGVRGKFSLKFWGLGTSQLRTVDIYICRSTNLTIRQCSILRRYLLILKVIE